MGAPTKKRTVAHTISGLKSRRLDNSRTPTEADIPLIKGMLLRGDVQSDIAAYFGTNGGRVSEVNTKQKYAHIKPAPRDKLPPAGPYMAARSAIKAKETLEAVHELIGDVLVQINLWEVQQ